MEPRRHDLLNSVGLLVLRLGIGGYMLTHGLGKLWMHQAGELGEFDPIGLGAGLSAALIVFAEFVCSLLVMAGLATRLAAVPVVVAMGVAALLVHGADPWTMEHAARSFFAGKSQSWASKEPALLYLFPFLTLVFTGAGRFSLDALIWPRWRRWRAGAADRPAASA